MANDADGILEDIACTYCVSTLDVVHALPDVNRKIVTGDRLASILEDVSGWGPVLFIVHTHDLVLECEGPLPRGSYGRGFFSLHGDSPIGGHIRASRCREIAFVSRPFMGRESRSIQFFNFDGDRQPRIRYDSPVYAGFQLSASAGSDQRYDGAITYGGNYDTWTASELGAFTVLGALSAYQPNDDGLDYRMAASWSSP